MKITAENGNVIDLEFAREMQRKQGYIHPHYAAAVFLALEAALRVEPRGNPDYDQAIRHVRQAIGVVEEPEAK